jgi:hypothetical protein
MLGRCGSPPCSRKRNAPRVYSIPAKCLLFSLVQSLLPVFVAWAQPISGVRDAQSGDTLELQGKICNPYSEEFKRDPGLFQECREHAYGGNAFAAFSIGSMYDQGLGVPKDDGLAYAWYLIGAWEGEPDAQLNFAFIAARMHALVQAHAWFNVAAATFSRQEGGYAERQGRRAAEMRDKTAALLNRKQLDEAYRLAKELSMPPPRFSRDQISKFVSEYSSGIKKGKQR